MLFSAIFLLLSIQSINCFCYVDGGSYSCMDMEMFEQCNYAQMKINEFAHMIVNINNTYQLMNQVPDLKCDRSMNCYYHCNDGSYKCQNLDSYDKCANATLALDGFILNAQKHVVIDANLIANRPAITCVMRDSDVCNYRSSGSLTECFMALIFVLLLAFV